MHPAITNAGAAIAPRSELDPAPPELDPAPAELEPALPTPEVGDTVATSDCSEAFVGITLDKFDRAACQSNRVAAI